MTPTSGSAESSEVGSPIGSPIIGSEAFTPNATCPVNGDFSIAQTTALMHAYEIDGPNGNRNGFCESGETCAFAPNIGAYQGEGTDLESCDFTDGTLTDIILIGKEYSRAP